MANWDVCFDVGCVDGRKQGFIISSHWSLSDTCCSHEKKIHLVSTAGGKVHFPSLMNEGQQKLKQNPMCFKSLN